MVSSRIFSGGWIVPTLQRLVVTREEWYAIGEHLVEAIHPADVLFLTVVASFAVHPIGSSLYALYGKYGYQRHHHRIKKDKQPETLAQPQYENSNMYVVCDLLSQVAQLALLVFVVDCLVICLKVLGFEFRFFVDDDTSHSHYPGRSPVTTSMEEVRISVGQSLSKIVYIAWAAYRLSILKRYVLSQAVERHPDRLGRVSLVDKIVDAIIYMVTAMFVLDVLDVELGAGVRSIFAFGSAGTLVVGLASKDAASMLVSGITLSTADRIAEGDHVRFGDGTAGKVIKIGWFHTYVP